jgi:hypothetical protein
MKKQYYFLNEYSEICYTKSYFDEYMKDNGIDQVKVFEAIPDKTSGVFWCKCDCFCGDDSSESCGKQCLNYSPRNGKSGCCKYYTTTLYLRGDSIILRRNGAKRY